MNRFRLAMIGVLSLAGMLVACTDEPAAPEAEDSLLQFVPADTPYAFISNRRLPDELRTRLGDHAALQLASQRAAFKQVREDLSSSEDGDAFASQADEAFEFADALLAEFEGRETAAQLREIGIEPLPHAVYFGIGLLPAARIEISDRIALNALLDRVEERVGKRAQRAELNGQAYRRIDLGSLDAVLAVTPTELLAGLLPDALFDRDLPLLLGQVAPAKSLADTGVMDTLSTRHGFTGYGEGFLRLDSLVAALLGQSDGYNADVMNALGAEVVPLSAGCLDLIDSMVAGMPRLVVGVSDVDAAGLQVKSIWESSENVAKYLRRLAAPVPGLGVSSDALFAVGVGIELPQLRNGIEALLRQVIDKGADCEWVEPEKIEAAIPQLSLVLGPMTAGIKGFNLEVNSVALNPETHELEAVDASLLAAVDDPRGVFALGGMFNPALAALEIPMDGTPVALPRDLVPGQYTPPLQVAMRDKALVLIGGDATAASVDTLFAAATPTPAPLFAIDYGVRQLVDLLGDILDQTAEDMLAMGETELAGEIAKQWGDIRMQAQLFERVSINVYASEQGLVMEQAMQLR